MEAKFNKYIEKLKADSDKLELGLSNEILISTAEELGPIIYSADAKFVDSKSQEELNIIKNEFLIKKLNLIDDSTLDDAILNVLEKLKALKNKKHRVLVYALLKKHFADVKIEVKKEVAETKSFTVEIFNKIKKFFS